MNFTHSDESIVKLKTDVLVVGKFKGEKLSGQAKKINEALGGILNQLAVDEEFEGDPGRGVMVNSTFGKIGAKRVLLLGLGDKAKFTSDIVRKSGISAAKKVRNFCSTIAFGSELCDGRGFVSALAEGLMLGVYDFNKYKSESVERTGIDRVVLLSAGIKDKVFDKEVGFAKAVSESTNLARDLVNEPPVYMTPAKLAEAAETIAEEGKLECEIFNLEEIRKRGMGGLMAVSSGSDEEPRFIHLKYEPSRKPKKNLAIVGKGITFDSGGLCLKPADSMRTMKMDMAGAAAVIGVMKAISALKPSVRVHGLIASSENMTGPKAYKPDDVIKAYNGKTIEVINTDAEGRIVLSDALSFAVEQVKADEIVDLATLTGACMVGLGTHTAGLMGNNRKLIDSLKRASEKAGEKIWELPMDDELRTEIKSEVADIKNAGSRWGGAITAAMFLENFVGDTPWAHIDIAGPAYTEKDSSWEPIGGTGFGVRTVINYILGG
ncbi:MAG: leucyl aminopeptidase [Deltaproteobacteria bacterium]